MQTAALDAGAELRWEGWHLAHTRRSFRILAWLVAGFYASFAPLDLLVTPPALIAPFWAVRAGVIVAAIVCLRLSRGPWFERRPAELSAGFIVAVVLTSLSWMAGQLDGAVAVYTAAVSTSMMSVGSALLFLWPPRVVVVTQVVLVLPFVLGHLPFTSAAEWEIRIPSTFFVVMGATVATVAQLHHWRSRREQLAAQVRVERLEQSERRAREALQSQARELASANGRLLELDQLKTNLIANVSHDLRTPLTLILTAFDDLARRRPEDDRGTITMGERNASRLLHLIDDLLALARLDSAGARVRKVRFDLTALLADLAAAFRSGPRHTLVVSGLDGPVPVDGDPHLIANALSNLVANALKFTERAVPRVDLRLARDGDQVVVEVEDDGIGIAPEELARIFDRFAQVDSGAGRRFPGSGIGLAMVREVVAAHGGSVSVRSAPGVGSTFAVRLPVAVPDPGQEAVAIPAGELARRVAATVTPTADEGPAGPSVPPPVGAATALVVEDNPDMRAALARSLGREYHVRTAADGAEGLAALRAGRVDLVVTDERMPGTSGTWLVEAMQRDPSLADVPVIFVTAQGDAETRVRLLEIGGDDMLVKPFHDAELLARGRRLVAARRQAQRLEQANRDLDLFASTAAHDLQAPVRALGGFAAALRRELGQSAGPTARGYLDQLEEGARRVTALIRGMLELARLSPASDGETVGTVDLGAVVRDVTELLAGDLEETGGEIVAAPLPVIAGDARLVHLLVQNLVANALKFHRPGVPPRVSVTARAVDGVWELAFADNGIGFEPGDAERIFEPLRRLHGAGAYPGSGLGLAICRRIAERHGGAIRAEAAPGQGATFTVVLPADPALVMRGEGMEVAAEQ